MEDFQTPTIKNIRSWIRIVKKMIKNNINCQNNLKQLTINNYFTKITRTLKKTKRISIIHGSIQTDNIHCLLTTITLSNITQTVIHHRLH